MKRLGYRGQHRPAPNSVIVPWRERGSVSVLLLGVVGTLFLLAGVLALYGTAVLARHQAAAAADLGSLAGAQRAFQGPTAACQAAATVIAANTAHMIDCHLDGLDLTVTVEVQRGGRHNLGPARVTARAGPVETRSPNPSDSAEKTFEESEF